MARRGRGVGGGNRLALRGFTKIFKDLPPTTRARLESALVETEDLMDIHTVSSTSKVSRRKLNPLLDQPVVEVENSILGGSIFWDRVNDPRITFYEVQVDNTNTFPAPESYQIVEPFFSMERITSRKFLRVRGVRMDGQVGNWSTTIEMDPTIVAPLAHTWNFYQRYEGAGPDLTIPNEFGGDPTPGFYTLMEHSFYTMRNVGGMMVYGYVSNRLKDWGDSTSHAWDRVRFRVNGLTREEGYFSHWTDSSIDPATGQRYQSGLFYDEPISFYGKGGYTASFGPFAVSYPNTFKGDGYKDSRKITSRDAGETFYWQNVKDAMRPTRWDRSLLSNIYSPERAFEANVNGVLAEKTTNWLVCQDFGFVVPQNQELSGIKMAIKRRSNKAPNISIAPDFGRAVVNRPMTTLNSSDSDIAEDDAFGKHIDMTDDALPRGIATLDDLPIGLDGNWTMSNWFLLSQLPTGAGNKIVWKVEGSNKWFYNVLVHQDDLYIFYGRNDGVFNTSGLQMFAILNAGVWYNVVTTFAQGDEYAKLYVNGVWQDPIDNQLGSQNPIMLDQPAVDVNIPFTVDSDTLLSVGQHACWNTVLQQGDIDAIYAGKGRIDLRINQSTYAGADNLQHYWVFLPDESDMRDLEVRLVDSANQIRTDLANGAITSETWPKLADFFYVNNAVDGEGKKIATSTGIPHDSVTGIGYQEYGSPTDLWNAEYRDDSFYGVLISPSSLMDPNFGCAIRAKNHAGTFAGNGFIDHVKMQLLWRDTSDLAKTRVDLKIEAEGAAGFYIKREVFGGIFNGIEVGESL